jgi:hypothetical protein
MGQMKLFLLLALAASAGAQPTLVTIADYLGNADGTPFTGQITLTPQGLQAPAASVRSRPITICSVPTTFATCSYTMSNGDLSIGLVPNGTASPAGTYYSVKYITTVPGTQGPSVTYQETWVVPGPPGPYTIAQILVAVPPQLQVVVSPAQISGAGYSNGQSPTWSSIAGAFLPASASGSGNVNYGVNSVACSSAPTFNLNSASYSVQSVSLTCAITSMSFQNLAAGALVTFRFCRTGSNQSFSGWPGAVHGGMLNASPIASTCDSQSFYSPDGANLYSNGLGALNQP